jgi:nitrate reductase NapAB chaperone NapD
MAMKLSTTLGHIHTIPNSINASLVMDFYHYLKEIGTSENYQNTEIFKIITHKIINVLFYYTLIP